MLTLPSVSSCTTAGAGVGGLCGGSVASGGMRGFHRTSFVVSALCDLWCILFRVVPSMTSDGSCKDASKGCIGKKEIDPYELCEGTGPPAGKRSCGLFSRVRGELGLWEYVDMLIAIAFRDERRLCKGVKGRL